MNAPREHARRDAACSSGARWDRRDLLAGDFDLLRLRFLTLRDANGQDAVFVGRADAIAVGRGRQVERSAERAAESLAPLQALDRRGRPLARQRQDVVLEREM